MHSCLLKETFRKKGSVHRGQSGPGLGWFAWLSRVAADLDVNLGGWGDQLKWQSQQNCKSL